MEGFICARGTKPYKALSVKRGGKIVKAGHRILGSKDLIGSGDQQMAIESKRLGEETKAT